MVDRGRMEAVDEVDVTSVGNPFVDWTVGARQVDFIPPDLRDFKAGLIGKADNASLKYLQTQGAAVEFFAAVKEGLVTHANPEKGLAGFYEVAGGRQQFLSLECIETIIEGSDPRQDHASGAMKFTGFRDHADVCPNKAQCFLDASQIPGTIVNQGNHADILSHRSNSAQPASCAFSSTRDGWFPP